jgi:hypothetical protein
MKPNWKSACTLVGLVLLVLPACDLIGEEDRPAPLIAFFLVPEGITLECTETSDPPCLWITEGTLTALVPGRGAGPEGSPWTEIALNGGDQRLRLHPLTPDLVPLEVGNEYAVSFAAFWTSTISWPSLIVEDEAGLAFYGTTTFMLYEGPEGEGQIPPPLVPEGWAFRLEPTGYDSETVACGVQTTPRTLLVEHGGERVRLLQGEAKRIGAYMVQARVAQESFYPNHIGCTDALLPDLSVVVYRIPE